MRTSSIISVGDAAASHIGSPVYQRALLTALQPFYLITVADDVAQFAEYGNARIKFLNALFVQIGQGNKYKF